MKNRSPKQSAPATRNWAALLALVCCAAVSTSLHAQATPAPAGPKPTIAPIDPQKVQDQDDMTWADYHPIPDQNWQDPAKKASVRALRVAMIAIDFPDQDFVITKPKKSDPFGNPQIDPIKREQVPQWLADFWHKPSEVNHGQTINGYWMEQSRGKYGIAAIDAFGPYKMPHPLWFYGGNEHGQNNFTPDGSRATGRMEPDCDALWRAEPGITPEERARRNTTRGRGDAGGGVYDQIIRIYAGYDETGVWQEFGEMKFETKEDITPEFGNPNPEKQRWVPSRYVPWTSWLAGMQQWGVSSIRQGENSGTIMHELGHSFFSTGDNNNNPYATPYRRVGSGPWDMMDRGSFNGPGGPHTRYVVPVQAGGSMPAGLMLRQKVNFGFVTKDQVFTVTRAGLTKSGVAVADVTCREVDPLPGSYAGIRVTLDGGAPGESPDRTPISNPATDPLSPGNPLYTFYTLECVQRIGYDSFTPDNGVLIAKNKDRESSNGGPNGYNCFNWVIDAHPEDINVVDFKRPKSGTPVMRTVADYRQLNDALFHAGTNSGSKDEFEDTPNRLHFYVIDVHHDAKGILSYTLAVRSLDGAGPLTRGVSLTAGDALHVAAPAAQGSFTLTNTGTMPDAQLAPGTNNDVYRISVASSDPGWTAEIANEFAAVKIGAAVKVPVFVTHKAGGPATGSVVLTATSESDPTKTVTATLAVSAP